MWFLLLLFLHTGAMCPGFVANLAFLKTKILNVLIIWLPLWAVNSVSWAVGWTKLLPGPEAGPEVQARCEGLDVVTADITDLSAPFSFVLGRSPGSDCWRWLLSPDTKEKPEIWGGFFSSSVEWVDNHDLLRENINPAWLCHFCEAEILRFQGNLLSGSW